MTRLKFAALIVFMAASAAASFGQTPAAVLLWSETAANQLGALIPETMEGLVDELPWEPHRAYPVMLSGCPIGCLQFSPLSAERKWRVDDPALIARHEAAEKKALADAVTLTAKFGSIPNDEYTRRVKEIEQSTMLIERRARGVTLTIQGNLRAQAQGMEGAAVPAGSLRGLSLQRFGFTSDEYAPTTRGIRLAVFLGPGDFSNPKVSDAQMQGQLKAITVSASVQTLPETADADEALLRKLLEKVDYEALRKLIR